MPTYLYKDAEPPWGLGRPALSREKKRRNLETRRKAEQRPTEEVNAHTEWARGQEESSRRDGQMMTQSTDMARRIPHDISSESAGKKIEFEVCSTGLKSEFCHLQVKRPWQMP